MVVSVKSGPDDDACDERRQAVRLEHLSDQRRRWSAWRCAACPRRSSNWSFSVFTSSAFPHNRGLRSLRDSCSATWINADLPPA